MIWPSSSWSTADSEPCSTPARPPTVSGAPWRPVSSPSPAGLDADQRDAGVADERR